MTKNVRDVTWLYGHQKLSLYSLGSSNMTVSVYLLKRIISCLLPGNLLSKISQTWHIVSAKSLLAILLFNRQDITAGSTNVAVIYNDSNGQELSRVFMHRRLPLILWCLMDRTSSDGLEEIPLHEVLAVLKCHHSQWISVMTVSPAESQNWCSQSLVVVEGTDIQLSFLHMS